MATNNTDAGQYLAGFAIAPTPSPRARPKHALSLEPMYINASAMLGLHMPARTASPETHSAFHVFTSTEYETIWETGVFSINTRTM
ncbi:MAG: hypothetical protein EPO09_01050 [Aquabacterium sp.]|nr:MAG: hypothetical protein EPO09_01050 [Aquabacterium sp.]